MRILWHSVAPWVGTGYGQQTATFTPRIAALGHDVAISAFYGLGGSEIRWQGIRVFPQYTVSYGNDVVLSHALEHFGAHKDRGLNVATARGLVMTLCDVWVLDPKIFSVMNAASWAPVDHDPIPPMVANWFVNSGAIPIAMSRFGERMFVDAGFTPLYVPHGIDTEVFSPGDRGEARQAAGLPEDAFVVAMVAANIGKDPCRKAFAEQISAFAELRRKHSDAVLALHTDIDSPGGVRLRDILADLPEGSVKFTDQYAYRRGVPASTVAQMYRAADVLTNASYGEGFGVPIVEAQACGTPVVVTDTTAMPELVGAGWTVGGEKAWHEAQRSWYVRPSIADLTDAYLEAYDKARDEQMAEKARAFALQYDADVVAEMYWRPVLAKLEEALERRRADVTKPDVSEDVMEPLR